MHNRLPILRRAVLVFGIAISALLLLSTLLEHRHSRVRAAERGLDEPEPPLPIELAVPAAPAPERPPSACERGSEEAAVAARPLALDPARSRAGIQVREGRVWLLRPRWPEGGIDYLGPDPERLDPAERAALLVALDRLREGTGPLPRRLVLPAGEGWRELRLHLPDHRTRDLGAH